MLTRPQARAAGLALYGPTKVCKRGHSAARYAANALCVECARAYAAIQRITKPEAKRESARRCRPQRRAYIRQYYRAHPEVWRRRETRLQEQRCECCSPEQLNEFFVMAQILGFEVDHRTPLALGGKHCAKNLQVLSPQEHLEKTRDDMRSIRAERVLSAH